MFISHWLINCTDIFSLHDVSYDQFTKSVWANAGNIFYICQQSLAYFIFVVVVVLVLFNYYHLIHIIFLFLTETFNNK